MEFKKVCPEEIDAIVRIEQSGFTPEEAGSKATFIERIKNFSETFWVAVEDDEIRGFICAIKTNARYVEDWMYEVQAKPDDSGKYLNVLSVAVAPEYRGKHIGSDLLINLEKIAKKLGIDGISLTCLESKVGFYEKNGYSNKGKSSSEHAGEIWYNMEKEL